MSSDPDQSEREDRAEPEERGAQSRAVLALIGLGAIVLLGALLRGCVALG
jgi:hypothetical protein